jgi:hypothetical protein
VAGVVSDLENWLVVTPGGIWTEWCTIPWIQKPCIQVNKETTITSLHYISLHLITMYMCTEDILNILIYSAVYCSILHDAILRHLYPTPVRYSTCSGSPSARSDPQPPRIQRFAYFLVEQYVNCRPLGGPDKIVIPLYLRTPYSCLWIRFQLHWGFNKLSSRRGSPTFRVRELHHDGSPLPPTGLP